MTRSRSINRFHRFVARKRRRGLRMAVPHLRENQFEMGDPIDVSDRLIIRTADADLRQEMDELSDV
jgi:hypothetical protein